MIRVWECRDPGVGCRDPGVGCRDPGVGCRGVGAGVRARWTSNLGAADADKSKRSRMLHVLGARV